MKTKLTAEEWNAEVARESLLKKEKLESLRQKVESSEEQEHIKWTVSLGKAVNKAVFKDEIIE